VFSLVLGYSRVPYAAALDGNYFKVFSRVHERYQFPHISLLALGTTALVFCFFRLADVISALVVILILLQFLLQAIGVIVLRIRRPEMPRPFRMWLYPIPSVLAVLGFGYIVIKRPDALKEIRYAAVILIAGLVLYFIRAWRNRDWPFSKSVPAPAEVRAS
jgi:amino acid transporter